MAPRGLTLEVDKVIGINQLDLLINKLGSFPGGRKEDVDKLPTNISQGNLL